MQYAGKRLALNTHRLDGDVIHVPELLQMGFNWDRRVRIEYVADEPVHLREMQIDGRRSRLQLS